MTSHLAKMTTTRTVFVSVFLGWRTLVDAIEHGEITTSGSAKAAPDLWALLADLANRLISTIIDSR